MRWRKANAGDPGPEPPGVGASRGRSASAERLTAESSREHAAAAVLKVLLLALTGIGLAFLAFLGLYALGFALGLTGR